MAELEAAVELSDRLEAEGAAGAARHVDASSASRDGYPNTVISRSVGSEPSALWIEAVEKFLVVSRCYLFPGPMAAVPRDYPGASRSRAGGRPA